MNEIILTKEMIQIIIIATMVLVTVLACCFVYLTRTLVQHRDFYNKRERWLISAIIAKDLPELAECSSAIHRTPADELKQTKLENDLAMNAAKLMDSQQGPNGHVIPVS